MTIIESSLRSHSSSSENSAFNTDFFGLMTTSTGIPRPGQCKRTASRNRRFMRLRSTAPPSTRPTVNPTQAPVVSLAQVKHGHVSWRNGACPACRPAQNRVPQQPGAARKSGPLARTGQILRCHSERRRTLFTIQNSDCGSQSRKGNRLLTETGLHRHPLAALGAPARDHRLAALGLHPRTKSVRLRAVTPVRLECALGHENCCS